VIKITATGGVLSVVKNGKKSSVSLKKKKQLLEQPKITICLRTAHAHGDEGIQQRLRRNKTIEHGTMNEETMD
jgi:imidazolonepropionase-like amidohydrolase